MTRLTTRLAAGVVALALVFTVAACGSSSGGSTSGSTTTAAGGSTASKGSIVIGSKLDPEAQMLGQLLALTLQSKGYKVTSKIPTGNTDITRAALVSGKIDIYWEFTSSGLAILKQNPIGDPTAAYTKIKQLDAKNGITWLPSAAMNDTYALAVLDNGPVKATSLSELAASPSGLKLCADPEGGFRTDVLPVIKTAYGLDFTDITQIGADLIPESVKAGKCNVGLVYATSALIPKNNLRILTDDKHAFGAYTPAPTIKTSNLAKYPTLQADLAPLTALLATPTITTLNAQAGGDDTKIKAVAQAFLIAHGIIGK